jgi:hypothetical protein
MTQVPQTVLDRVGGAIARLHEIRQRLDESRALDERFGGAGRYESEAHANRAGDMSWALLVLAKFEASAGAKGIETGPIYAGFGGVPDLSLSPVAQSYVNGCKTKQREGEEQNKAGENTYRIPA